MSTMDAPLFADDSVVNYLYFALWLFFVLAYLAYALGFFSLSGLPAIVLQLLEMNETSSPPFDSTTTTSALETPTSSVLFHFSPKIQHGTAASPPSFNIFRQIPEKWCWERGPRDRDRSPVWYTASADEKARIVTDRPTHQQRRDLQERYRREVDDAAQNIIRATEAEEKAVAEKAAAEAQQCKSKASADQGGLSRLSAALQEPLISLYDDEWSWCSGSIMQGVRWVEGLAPPPFMQALLAPSYTAPYSGIVYDANAGMPVPVASTAPAPSAPPPASNLDLSQHPLFSATGAGPSVSSIPSAAPPSLGVPSAPPPPAPPSLGPPNPAPVQPSTAPTGNLPPAAGGAAPAQPAGVSAAPATPQTGKNPLLGMPSISAAQGLIKSMMGSAFKTMNNFDTQKKTWAEISRSQNGRSGLVSIRDLAKWVVEWGTVPNGTGRDDNKLPPDGLNGLKLGKDEVGNLANGLAAGELAMNGQGIVAEASTAVAQLELLVL